MEEHKKNIVVSEIVQKINNIDNIETLKYINKYIELIMKKAGE